MSVTLSEVKRAARAHRAPLAGESAGYLVLALADQVLGSPRLIDAANVQLTDDGGLRVLRGEASSESEAELSLRRTLDALLLVASSGSAALTRASRRDEPIGLAALVRELEAALIPVNRGAARRALARLQRETARAVAGGELAADAPERHEPAPAPRAAVADSAALEMEGETNVIAAPVGLAPAESVAPPPALVSSNEAVSSLRDEQVCAVEESPLLDALTIALPVRAAQAMVEPTVLFDEDVEFIDEEPSEALTVARNLEVMPIASATSAVSSLVDLPEEACTRPEPVILRRSLRPLAQLALPVPAGEVLPRTPTLGSLAAELPVLAPEMIAELSRRESSEAPGASPEPDLADSTVEDSVRPSEVRELVVCSANEEHTERMPEVATLSPGAPIVASRKSDVNELLADFKVEPSDTHQGLRRAIKELAELDLTPAPFAALIR